MLRTIFITIIVCLIAFELIEHVILPFFWLIFQRRKRSACGVEGMIGRVAEIMRWDGTEGKVLIHGELWRAVCAVPLTVGRKVVVQEVQGLTLKLKPFESENEDFVEER
jgi:membrane-bound ClpP family serine protease